MARQITASIWSPRGYAELAERLEITTEDVRAGIAVATAHYAVSLDTQVSATDSGRAGALAGGLATEDDNYDRVETMLSVSAAVTRLPDLERQALTLRLDRTLTQSEIGRRLHCSQTHVSRLLRHAAATVQELIDPPVGEPALSPSAEMTSPSAV